MKIALFPGSFDPFTIGHLQVVKTSAKIMDKVIIGIAENSLKNRKHEVELIKRGIEETLKEEQIENCEVLIYNKLTVDFAKENGAEFIIRGLRDNIDYAYEEDIAKFNYEISGLETIYIRSNTNISSTFVNDMIKYQKDISRYVPNKVIEAIEKNPQSPSGASSLK